MCMYTYMKALGAATCMQDTLAHSIIIHIHTSMYVCVNMFLVYNCFCAFRLDPYIPVPATEMDTQAKICTCTSECLNHTLYTN